MNFATLILLIDTGLLFLSTGMELQKDKLGATILGLLLGTCNLIAALQIIGY